MRQADIKRGHMRSASKGLIRSRGSGSTPSHLSNSSGARIAGIRSRIPCERLELASSASSTIVSGGGASRSALLAGARGRSEATLADQAPAGNAWLHEIKWDGYRLGASFQNGRVTLLTRRRFDWGAERQAGGKDRK